MIGFLIFYEKIACCLHTIISLQERLKSELNSRMIRVQHKKQEIIEDGERYKESFQIFFPALVVYHSHSKKTFI